jgi:hypothetical protein
MKISPEAGLAMMTDVRETLGIPAGTPSSSTELLPDVAGVFFFPFLRERRLLSVPGEAALRGVTPPRSAGGPETASSFG